MRLRQLVSDSPRRTVAATAELLRAAYDRGGAALAFDLFTFAPNPAIAKFALDLVRECMDSPPAPVVLSEWEQRIASLAESHPDYRDLQTYLASLGPHAPELSTAAAPGRATVPMLAAFTGGAPGCRVGYLSAVVATPHSAALSSGDSVVHRMIVRGHAIAWRKGLERALTTVFRDVLPAELIRRFAGAIAPVTVLSVHPDHELDASDGSFGLAAVMSVLSCYFQMPLSPGVIFSGEVLADGSVGPVGFGIEKARAIALQSPSASLLIVHPADEAAIQMAAWPYLANVRIASVRNVREAISLLNWHLANATMIACERAIAPQTELQPEHAMAGDRRSLVGAEGRHGPLPVQDTALVSGREAPKPPSRWIRPRTAALIICTTLLALAAPSILSAIFDRPRTMRFGSDQIGVLMEQRAFGAQTDVQSAVEALQLDARLWARSVERDLDRQGWRYRPQEYVVRVVPSITTDALVESGAVLGVYGSVEHRRDPNGRTQFGFRGADVLLSPRGILPEFAPGDLKRNVVRMHRPPANRGRAEYWYYGRGIEYVEQFDLLLFAARAMAGQRLDADSPLETAPTQIEVRMGLGPAQHNLNRSFHQELGLVMHPSQTVRTTLMVSDDEIDFAALRDTAIAIYGLRVALRRALPGGTISESSSATPTIFGAQYRETARTLRTPPSIEQFIRELEADIFVLAQRDLSCGLELEGSIRAAPCSETPLPDDDALKMVADRYTDAARSGEDLCLSCVLSAVQLRLLADDDSGAERDVDLGLTRATGLDRLRLLLLRARLKMLQVGRMPDHSPARLGEDACSTRAGLARQALEYTRLVREAGATSIADFEEARLGFALSDCGDRIGLGAAAIEERLRRILSTRPRHLLVRFLLGKLLAARRQYAAAAWVIRDLPADALNHSGTYSEDYHSLGPGDDVNHTVDAAEVMVDFVQTVIAGCGESRTMESFGVAVARLPAAQIDEIRTAAEHPQARAAYYLFPMGGIRLAGFDDRVADWCPSGRAAQSVPLRGHVSWRTDSPRKGDRRQRGARERAHRHDGRMLPR